MTTPKKPRRKSAAHQQTPPDTASTSTALAVCINSHTPLATAAVSVFSPSPLCTSVSAIGYSAHWLPPRPRPSTSYSTHPICSHYCRPPTALCAPASTTTGPALNSLPPTCAQPTASHAKTTKGHSLSRRETRQLQRTTADLIRLVPFSIIVVVPFMELLLPVFLKLFPNMLPSTFQDSDKREQQLKRELKVRLNVAQFLTDTMERMAQDKATTKGESELKTTAEELLRLLNAARSGERLTTDQLLSVARLFDDEITFETLSSEQLRQVCRYLNIPTYGTYGGDGIMRYAISVKMERIHRDDNMLVDEGLDVLDEEELRAACRRRGMRDFGLTKEGYRRNLQQWLDLSMNKKIPDSLLLLSRAMSLSEEPTADDIAGALRSVTHHQDGMVYTFITQLSCTTQLTADTFLNAFGSGR